MQRKQRTESGCYVSEPAVSEEGRRARLFVGVRVSVATANALADAAELLARRARDAGVDIRWVSPMNYHVTLAFLGHQRVDAIPAVVDVLEEAAAGTPSIRFQTLRLGAFPSIEKGRVLWAGIEERGGEAVLDALARKIGQGLRGLGVTDRKPFHAHVTLGRLRETRPLRETVLPLSEQMFGETRVDQISLFESETKSSGSVYTELRRIDFKSARATSIDPEKRQTELVDEEARKQAERDVETDDGWPRGHRTDD